jgi:hypothetical protein
MFRVFSLEAVLVSLFLSNAAFAAPFSEKLQEALNFRQSQEAAIENKFLELILEAYKVRSPSDVLKKVVAQRDAVFGNSRPAEIQNALEKLTGEQIKTSIIGIRQSFTNEGIALTATFADARGMCKGVGPTYTVKLVIGENGDIDVWKYAKEEAGFLGGACN